MATINESAPGRWIVRYRTGEGKEQAGRRFRSLAAAQEFFDQLPDDIKRDRRVKWQRPAAEVVDSLSAYFDIDDNGCFFWSGNFTNEGYGRATWRDGDKLVSGAHRLTYWVTVEPVPDGMHIDHLCRNRACINPDHLEVVTPMENVLRSPIAEAALNKAKTHCAKGHEYTPENTQLYGPRHTWRICKACAAVRARRRYYAQKAVPA